MRMHVMVASGLGLALCLRIAHAVDVDPLVRAHAERLAVGTCGTCHGPHGNSQLPKYPRLAGQNANYLVAQLKNFRAQTRGDPDAVAYMWGMSANLDDATIAALADYYSKQAPAGNRVGDPAAIAKGQAIYEHGVEATGVPACGACHGPGAKGNGDFPRLAGQHAQYVLKQLASFQSNLRDVAVMHGVAAGLQLPEMEAVAAFVQAQP
jgi:cytochrome c553